MPKSSLMLAGGGLKIAFQAGVLQVWLDEEGIAFDHTDGVSAACFNLAMWAQGMSGRQIADNWGRLIPLAGIDVHWSQLLRLPFAESSIFELGAYRRKVFPSWGLDWQKIRASRREATFNVYNFSHHELRPVTAPEMSEDFLVAASLPIWFPPVRIDGDTYIDALFNTASNLEEAIRRGADELWVIWTTSRRGEWKNGFVGNFFGIFEATTNDGYKRMLARIQRNNEAVSRGEAGQFGRHIAVRELKAEVPLHYLFSFSRQRNARAVDLGVDAGRAWCAQHPEFLPGA